MHGNVCEWCWDVMREYGNSPAIYPEGPSDGPEYIMRGGAWLSPANVLRSARRYKDPSHRFATIGFRCIRIQP